ncbi:KH domain-containing protein akap-1-like [Brevipalpus obovatus]|uniref:KH domain-containing protein akap-1-like n=1 Tax=Brevipalpus obovatus TaxID=246614 RepID=UPI003D9DD894
MSNFVTEKNHNSEEYHHHNGNRRRFRRSNSHHHVTHQPQPLPQYQQQQQQSLSERSDSLSLCPSITYTGNNQLDNSLEDPVIMYQFELAQVLCGRLIGKSHHFVGLIKKKTNASVNVGRHPFSPYHKICSVEGTFSEIEKALRLIRTRFPLNEFPEVTLYQINVMNPIYQIPFPQSYQLQLPEGGSCDVVLPSMVNPGPIFFGQPPLPTYPQLTQLDQSMTAAYAPTETPPMINPDLYSVSMADSGSDVQVGPSDTYSGSHQLDSSVEDPVILYQFELAQVLCGRLIGKFGHFVNLIKEKSNASVIVGRHPFSPFHKICSVEGTCSEIKKALRIIRTRFPLNEFPEVTLHQVNVINPICQLPVPQSYQLQLPEGVSCDVILSSVVNAGHIFLRQPTHPTYPSLSRLDQFMTATYAPTETPAVINPDPGVICSVPMMGGWYRAMVVSILGEDECEVKFVDYGGYEKVSISSLRQIRYDFMTLPFQASECYLANIKPTDEDQGWSEEANTVFHDLAQGQMLQAKIVAYADDGVPMIHLHKVDGNTTTFINQELVNKGLAQWYELQF